MTTPWSGIALTAGTATGNLRQLYSPSCTAGSGATTSGTLKRGVIEGNCYNFEVESDGTAGGEIELWDINGADVGADVDTLDVITNAQLVAAVAAGRARKIWSQIFTGSSGARIALSRGFIFSHGLAARYINASGTCSLNLFVDGGCRYTEICG